MNNDAKNNIGVTRDIYFVHLRESYMYLYWDRREYYTSKLQINPKYDSLIFIYVLQACY
jgi:hypothetical protein